jgi:hypothetical protein
MHLPSTRSCRTSSPQAAWTVAAVTLTACAGGPSTRPAPPLSSAVVAPAPLAAAPMAPPAPLAPKVAELAGTGYLDAMLRAAGVVERWPERFAEPIRVWIAPDPTLPDWNPLFGDAARSALDDWAQSGIPVRFIDTDSATAEVRVRWTDRLSDWRSAVTTRLISNRTGWVRSAEVVLAVHASDGAPQTPASLGVVARHEVGHLLGLGHSHDPATIMAEWVTASGLTASDRLTVRALYRLPPGPYRHGGDTIGEVRTVAQGQPAR